MLLCLVSHVFEIFQEMGELVAENHARGCVYGEFSVFYRQISGSTDLYKASPFCLRKNLVQESTYQKDETKNETGRLQKRKKKKKKRPKQ